MKLTESFLDKYKERQVNWGFGALGEVVYLRTYSRPLPDGGTETWWQTVQRVVEGIYDAQILHCEKNGLPFNNHRAQRSAQIMYDLIFSFKFLPPGRGLWAMGTEYVRERGSAALNNCAFITTTDIRTDFAAPFTFLMDMSMLGVGVGSDTRGAGYMAIKDPKNTDDEHLVADSREGWVESVRILLDAFATGGSLPRFSYASIRREGVPLKGFGGISSGKKPLVELHQALYLMYKEHVGKPVTSTLIVDTFNLIGKAVVSGGIRRTAEIMLGFPGDADFLSLKDPSVSGANLLNHRWASNNSLIASLGLDYSNYIDQILTNGEPGFFWLDNARNYRRMKDKKGNWDQFVMGQNPCGEISLESGELCNLVEVYPAAHENWEDFQTTLKFAYLYAKSVSLIPTHNLFTNAVVGRNRRLGISLSGVVQAINKLGARQMLHWMDEGYKYLRHADNIYSKWLCVPESIKLTTVKPSGTISLLTGSSPGIHHPHSEYYVRNVRFDPHSPLLPKLRKAGYPVQESVADDNTFVVSFPVKEEHYSVGKKEISVWEQFELAAQMQHYWADNSVSVTVTVKPEEKRDLAKILSLYETRLKSVSMLPLTDHGYEQAPYTEIGPGEYQLMMEKIKNVKLSGIEAHDIEESGCTTDRCSII